MRTLIWFRSDLRCDDNPALAAAVEAGTGGVVALFAICSDQWSEHDWGAPKIDFVLRSADALRRRLETIGVPMVFVRTERFDDVAERIVRLTADLDVDAVFANREYEVNERCRDRQVEEAVHAAGGAMHWFHDQTVVPPGALKTGAGTPYSVYSPFRRAWERQLEAEGVPEPLPAPQRARRLRGLRAADLGSPMRPSDEPGGKLAELWPAGEVEACRRLDLFVRKGLDSYSRGRDIASLDATSRLSPYLAVGTVSVRRCLQAALRSNAGRLSGGDPDVERWIGELVWRDFYRHVMVGFPRVSRGRAFRRETESVRWRDNDADFEAWSTGHTGVPFVDAGMRELATTGFMHNRLRMVTAMFLTKDLLIDWRWGERFFMRHLVDADLANNNGGWQWSASTGTDAAPYFRIFNPWIQGKRYDPAGLYIRRWVPELCDVPDVDLHDPHRLAPHLGSTDYPMPMVSHKAARIRALSAFEESKRIAGARP
jgi:deoxyribodipyrimidine photo-lyase